MQLPALVGSGTGKLLYSDLTRNCTIEEQSIMILFLPFFLHYIIVYNGCTMNNYIPVPVTEYNVVIAGSFKFATSC